ncbi:MULTISPECIES: hypothetical protein [unclassified Streptomyces]|uniref:hypothetical protein n=1 Tax=unclassified Streptomyces TaxID=2593676 RepID=UPI0001C1CB6D|nr:MULTISPECIES: hypothetical protein [unclassified Streptomyces]AEN10766.1 hypothetical protein SACTE_2893 [Streptomyces sp. SirexAA-E]MYR65442.1 hypothetical protein [Streptomyces sp. SID4939]MYS01404.1 hypothetical protein [Streptomyces sp. SID4940]MYT62534.1 hypothetical protein [Streptomyces sp. SID8357]MYT89341.1 hypothetical protein [Streptomyces sp. SID8360]
MRIKDCDRAHLVVSEARAERARTASAPGELVRQAKRLVEKADELLEQAVIAERERGTSWERIGQALGGQSKSAAHKRYAPALTEHLECVDATTVEDEDSGEELLVSHSFLVPYGLLENTWNEAKQIVESQEALDHLREATVATSGDAGTAADVYYTPRALIDQLEKVRLTERAVLQPWMHPAAGSASMLRDALEYVERRAVEERGPGSLAARLEAVESRLAAVEAALLDTAVE